MACELEPLSWKEFQERYRFAWNNGWVFGTAFTELYLDYLDGWCWFLKHLDMVVEHAVKQGLVNNEISIKILIGEAPPMWRGTNHADERTYFYNADQDKGNQPWYYNPFKYFNQNEYETDWEKDKYKGRLKKKSEKLDYLAGKGVILIDVFPFPIIQDTNNRQAIDKKKKETSFSTHVNEYLIEHLRKLIAYLECKIKAELTCELNFECAFMAPEYTSLQLMYDPDINLPFESLNLLPLKDFNVCKISEITFEECIGKIPLESNPSESKAMSYFLYKLNKEKPIIKSNSLENIPILISDGIPNFENFFNSSEQKIKEKFSKKSKKE